MSTPEILPRASRTRSTTGAGRLILCVITLGCVLAVPAAAWAQGGSGQTVQSPAADRKEALKFYLPREASIRLPQRYAVRGGIDPSAPSHLSKGETEYRAGRNAAAVPELRQAVKESPDSYDSHYLLALTLTETGALKEAIEEFKKAMALATTDDSKIVGYYNMGNAYFDLMDYQNAAGAYQSALKIDGTLSRVHNNLGLALAGLKRTSDAAIEFKQAVDLKPQYAEAHYHLGVAYWQLGKKSEAEEVVHALAGINAELAEKLKRLINP
jgi:tetratricopeptide (TPR) repeat protein